MVFKMQLEKKWDKVHQVYNKGVKVSKFPNVLYFRKHSPNFGPFAKFTSIRKTISSGLKRVATGSVSKRYQTSVFAQLSKTLLETESFDLFCPIFIIQKPSSEVIRYEVTFQRKTFRAFSWVRMV